MKSILCDICKKRIIDTYIETFRGIQVFSCNLTIKDKKLYLCPICYKKINKFLDELKSENKND